MEDEFTLPARISELWSSLGIVKKAPSLIPSLLQNPGKAGFEGPRCREGRIAATLPNADPHSNTHLSIT